MILQEETQTKLGKSFEDAGQKAKIVCRCDYCEVVFERMKHNLVRSHKHIQTDSCPDLVCVQKKRVEVNRLLFGTDNAFQNTDIKEKIAEGNLKKYGVTNPFQNKEVQEKQKATCLERYGAANPFGNDQVKDKIKSTIQMRYGVGNPTICPKIRKKQRETMIKKYGVGHALQDPELRMKAMDTCISNHGKFPAHGVYGKTQKEIQEWLNSFGFDFKANRSLVKGREIDLYDASKSIALEYCGLHWHHEFSQEPRDHNYHYQKHKSCLDQGVQLLTIFSDEWEAREEQCKGHIKSLLGICEKRVYGRQCSIEEIDKETGRKFVDDNHIQGRNKLGIVFFGLFYKEELYGVISLGRHNRQVDQIVLDRLCFKNGIQVTGGASKLFSRAAEWAKNNGYTEIVSFSDNRWSVGKIYEVLGFYFDREYRPDYSYVNTKRPNERMSKQSQKKDTVDCPDGLTEFQWAHQRGLARIWDCGKKRWLFAIGEK